MIISKITFDDILPIWKDKLWNNRISDIKTHSSMTCPIDKDSIYDMKIYEYPATYWAVLHNDIIVGVNSGHKTSDCDYRSRGLWVATEYRGNGLGKLLLDTVIDQAILEECNIIWSVPRLTALPTYEKAGFETIGNIFKTETADKNVYAIKRVKVYT